MLAQSYGKQALVFSSIFFFVIKKLSVNFIQSENSTRGTYNTFARIVCPI